MHLRENRAVRRSETLGERLDGGARLLELYLKENYLWETCTRSTIFYNHVVIAAIMPQRLFSGVFR
jgi:hypothetical protein